MARPKLTHARTEITVCGSGRFPFDMLRYDQCAPRDFCGGFFGGDTREFRIVTLNMYGTGGPSFERWQSFGWHVLTGTQLAAYHADPSIEAVANLRKLIETTASL